MVIGYHIILTAYGFWLPNDPRGSWSDFVRQWELLAHGPATKTDLRRSLARDAHDRPRRLAAKRSLQYQTVEFSGRQALSVSRGFARACKESGYVVLACSILPKHVHLVVSRHEQVAERIAAHLKARATQQLVADGMHPFAQSRGKDGRFPSVWTHRPWKVYLNDYDDVARAIRYVQNNPVKDGKRPQRWSFVTPWVRPQSAPTLVAPRLAAPLAGRFPIRKRAESSRAPDSDVVHPQR